MSLLKKYNFSSRKKNYLKTFISYVNQKLTSKNSKNSKKFKHGTKLEERLIPSEILEREKACPSNNQMNDIVV
jgi:hypothetical protein